MAKMQYLVWFVLFRKFSCTLYIERHEQDLIKDVSLHTCLKYKGDFDSQTGTCRCPRDSTTFSSSVSNAFDSSLRCSNIKTTRCRVMLHENHRQTRRLFTTVAQHDKEMRCHNKTKIYSWNITTNDELNKQGGRWVDSTRKSTNDILVDGRLFKIVYGCKDKCIVVKVITTTSSDDIILDEDKLANLTQLVETTKTVTLKNTKKKRLPAVDKETDMWMKFAVITAIVSIMVFLCVVVFAVIHICHVKMPWVRKVTVDVKNKVRSARGNSTIEMIENEA